jgi:hypothetical protein
MSPSPQFPEDRARTTRLHAVTDPPAADRSISRPERGARVIRLHPVGAEFDDPLHDHDHEDGGPEGPPLRAA